jgi:hypothetical protein
VSEETIKHHLTRMFDKVGASNRVELARLAAERGLIDSPSARSVDAAPSPATVPQAMVTSG